MVAASHSKQATAKIKLGHYGSKTGHYPWRYWPKLGHSKIQNRPPIKKPRLIWDLGAGLLCQDYPASLEGAPKERLLPDSQEQSSGLKFNVLCRARHSAQIAPQDGLSSPPELGPFLDYKPTTTRDCKVLTFRA
jgi:hypothetical protein